MTSLDPAAWKAWRAAKAGARLHHAWLLTGAGAAAASAFADAAARDLVGAGERTDHPDILRLSPGPKDDKEERKRQEGKPYARARSVRIAQVREIQARLATRPTLGAWRAIVIDPADDLERGAANALLKSLEEPPAGTIFLLVAGSAARLLPTIRSRCRLLRLIGGAAPVAGSGELDDTMRSLVDGQDARNEARAALAAAFAARPDAAAAQTLFGAARQVLGEHALRLSVAGADTRTVLSAMGEIDRLAAEYAHYNYDGGLLGQAIAGLLAQAGTASAPGDA